MCFGNITTRLQCGQKKVDYRTICVLRRQDPQKKFPNHRIRGLRRSIAQCARCHAMELELERIERRRVADEAARAALAKQTSSSSLSSPPSSPLFNNFSETFLAPGAPPASPNEGSIPSESNLTRQSELFSESDSNTDSSSSSDVADNSRLPERPEVVLDIPFSFGHFVQRNNELNDRDSTARLGLVALTEDVDDYAEYLRDLPVAYLAGFKQFVEHQLDSDRVNWSFTPPSPSNGSNIQSFSEWVVTQASTELLPAENMSPSELWDFVLSQYSDYLFANGGITAVSAFVDARLQAITDIRRAIDEDTEVDYKTVLGEGEVRFNGAIPQSFAEYFRGYTGPAPGQHIFDDISDYRKNYLLQPRFPRGYSNAFTDQLAAVAAHDISNFDFVPLLATDAERNEFPIDFATFRDQHPLDADVVNNIGSWGAHLLMTRLFARNLNAENVEHFHRARRVFDDNTLRVLRGEPRDDNEEALLVLDSQVRLVGQDIRRLAYIREDLQNDAISLERRGLFLEDIEAELTTLANSMVGFLDRDQAPTPEDVSFTSINSMIQDRQDLNFQVGFFTDLIEEGSFSESSESDSEYYPQLDPSAPGYWSPTPSRSPLLHAHGMRGVRSQSPESEVSDLEPEDRLREFHAMQQDYDDPTDSSDDEIDDSHSVMRQAADFLNGRSHNDDTDVEDEIPWEGNR
jgi:hypothetical protein